MRRGFSLLLIVGSLAAVGLTGTFVTSHGSASSVAKSAVPLRTATGAASSEGYLVQLKEPPLYARPEVSQAHRNVRTLQRALAESTSEGKSVPLRALTALRQSVTAAQTSLSRAIFTAQIPMDRERESVVDKVNAILKKNAKTNGGVQIPTSLSTGESDQFTHVFNGFALPVTVLSAEEIAAIASIPGVQSVVPNITVEATLMDTVPLMNADDVWQRNAGGMLCKSPQTSDGASGTCITGKGVKIGIIDSGIDYKHPGLGGCLGPSCKVKGGYDFINRDNDPMDDFMHGTAVSGAAAENGTLRGIAPDADLYAYKIFDNYGMRASLTNISAAIERAIIDGVDIINLSLGGGGGGYEDQWLWAYGNPDSPLSLAVDNAVNAGVVAVVSAGNDGTFYYTVPDPASARKAIAVGAITKSFDLSYFTAAGPTSKYTVKPDVVTFGERVCVAKLSAWGDAGYPCGTDKKHFAVGGTSIAAPQVAGIAALMLQAHPTWTPEQVKQTIRDTATPWPVDRPFSPSRLLNVGYGVADAYAAVFSGVYNPVSLHTIGVVPHTVDIRGDVAIPGFESYSVSLFTFNYDPPIVIGTGNAVPGDGVLVRDWTTGSLNGGQLYGLLLEVRDTDGRIHRDATVIASGCGNQICDERENERTCPTDCSGGCNYNGICDTSENFSYCWDCKESICKNNNKCEEGEDRMTCLFDCGVLCHDDYCDCSSYEDTFCPMDCAHTGASTSTCGDKKCDLWESYVTCNTDCTGTCNSNGICDPWEEYQQCPWDCPKPFCGDGVCQCWMKESITSCPSDCAPPRHSSSSSSSSSSESSEESSSSSESSDESSSSSESSEESSSESSEQSDSSSSESDTQSSSSDSSQSSEDTFSSSSEPISQSSSSSAHSSSSSHSSSPSSSSSSRSSSSSFPVSSSHSSSSISSAKSSSSLPHSSSSSPIPSSSSSSSSSSSFSSTHSSSSSLSPPSSSSSNPSSSSSSSSSLETIVCTDTDASQDPTLPGTVITRWGPSDDTREFRDNCGAGTRGNELTQFWCLSGGAQGAAGKTILCPLGCRNSACNTH